MEFCSYSILKLEGILKIFLVDGFYFFFGFILVLCNKFLVGIFFILYRCLYIAKERDFKEYSLEFLGKNMCNVS